MSIYCAVYRTALYCTFPFVVPTRTIRQQTSTFNKSRPVKLLNERSSHVWCEDFAQKIHNDDKKKRLMKRKKRLIKKEMTLTSYMTVVQPSIVMHWNTVSIARPKLSKLVMPRFGPTQ